MRRFATCFGTRWFQIVIVVALICVSSRFSAPAATPTPQAQVRAITGSFNCVTHDGGKIWRFHSVNTAWGGWLRADTTFAPQNGQPADIARTFVGFDRDAKQWNIVSIDASGSYYTRRSKSPNLNDSQWIDGYPADGGKAIIKLSSSGGYTFDLTTPNGNKPSDFSHTVCTPARA